MRIVGEGRALERRTRLAALVALRDRTKHVLLWIATCAERARQRDALARLDERLLSDAGISREDAAREISRPFWR